MSFVIVCLCIRLPLPDFPFIINAVMMMWLALIIDERTSSSQRAAPFQVALQDESRMLLSLDAEDVRPDASVYSVRVSGEPYTHTLLFTRPGEGQTLPHPLQFNASYHGLCYSISLMLGNHSGASRAVRTVPVLTSKTTAHVWT